MINGTDRSDILGGTDLDDTIFGGRGADVLLGRGGDDRLEGGFGDDIFFGGAGDDVIVTGFSGEKEVWAGLGNDFVNMRNTDSLNFDDRVDFEYRQIGGFIEVSFTSTGARVFKSVDGSTDKIVNANQTDIGLSDTAGDDRISIKRDAGALTEIALGAGDDRLFGGDGFERLTYGEDVGAGITVTILGYDGGQMRGLAEGASIGRDSFRFIDEINGSRAADTFFGGDGNDRFAPDAGDDIVYGGLGADLVSYDREDINGLDLDLAGETATVTYLDGDAQRGEWIDRLIDVENVRGSYADDRILGSDVDNHLAGRSGDDFIRAFDGNDTVMGHNGDDLLFGLAGNDTLDGGDGNDRLFGGAGRDILIAGRGADRLDGGGGADTFLFSVFDDENRIVGFQDGIDVIGVTSLGRGEVFDLFVEQDGFDTVLTTADYFETGVDLSIRLVDFDAADFGTEDWFDFFDYSDLM